MAMPRVALLAGALVFVLAPPYTCMPQQQQPPPPQPQPQQQLLPAASIHVDVAKGKEAGTVPPAMNGACLEALNHEIYGGIYSQLIHGESFEEPPGAASGVSGDRFVVDPSEHNIDPNWPAASGEDGNSTYITWQPLDLAPGSAGDAGASPCFFNVSATALNGNRSQQIGCRGGEAPCSCSIVNRGVDATGFAFAGPSTVLEGYLFAKLSPGSPAVAITVEVIDERARGSCSVADGGPGSTATCPVLAAQTFHVTGAALGTGLHHGSVPSTGAGGWTRLDVVLAVNGSTMCTNGTGIGPHSVRCVGTYGGGNQGYFKHAGHGYEENVCITCSGSVRVRATSSDTRPWGVLLDQVFLSPRSVYGGSVHTLPARLDTAAAMEQAWQALRFGGGMADGAGYRWKTMRGPRYLRPPMTDRRYPFHSTGFMMFEALELAEQLGLAETAIDFNENELSADAADFVEYAFGDAATTAMGQLRKEDGREKPYAPFRIELGNEEAVAAKSATNGAPFFKNVARVATAMASKARELQLPFKLRFAVGGPYEANELTDAAMAPMLAALGPIANVTDWYWDFHINGESRHLQAGCKHGCATCCRNITNAEYAAQLTAFFTGRQAFFDLRASGSGYMRSAVFEQNGGSHDMSRALGNARNSVVLGNLGGTVRMSVGANALQAMGHNDNGWDQGQLMLLPNQTIVSPFGLSNTLFKRTWQPTLLNVSTAGFGASNAFAMATRNASGATNLRIVNTNSTALPIKVTWGGGPRAVSARALRMAAESLDAVNTPAAPHRVAIEELDVPCDSGGGGLSYIAPRFSITVISISGISPEISD